MTKSKIRTKSVNAGVKPGRQAELQKAAGAFLDLFATIDDVYTEPDAFENSRVIRAGYGRLYRKWKEVRAVLDPTFDPKHFSLHKTTPMEKWIYQSPPVGGNRTSSSRPTRTSGLSHLKNALRELATQENSA